MNTTLDEEYNPELVALCLNCRKADCKGSCAAFRALADVQRDGAPPSRYGRHGKKYPHDVAWHTLPEWAEMLDVHLETLRKRVARGESVGDAAKAIHAHIDHLTRRRAEIGSIKDLAIAHGLKPTTVQNRLARGWDLETALSTPAAPWRRAKKQEGQHGTYTRTANGTF